jgi:hypothetical protein
MPTVTRAICTVIMLAERAAQRIRSGLARD